MQPAVFQLSTLHNGEKPKSSTSLTAVATVEAVSLSLADDSTEAATGGFPVQRQRAVDSDAAAAAEDTDVLAATQSTE